LLDGVQVFDRSGIVAALDDELIACFQVALGLGMCGAAARECGGEGDKWYH
jgi:hypothetical protein